MHDDAHNLCHLHTTFPKRGRNPSLEQGGIAIPHFLEHLVFLGEFFLSCFCLQPEFGAVCVLVNRLSHLIIQCMGFHVRYCLPLSPVSPDDLVM